MKHLLLDTSTERGFVALAEGDHLIEAVHLPYGLQNSKFLLPSLQKLLEEHKLAVQELQLISCGIGPGSYTGIRIGASLAQALSYAQKIPLVQFSSLEGFIPDKSGPFVAVIDAKIGGVYAFFATLQDGHVKQKSDFKLIPPDQILDVFKSSNQVVSPSIDPLKKKIDFAAIEWLERSPSVEFLAKTCFLRFKQGNFSKEGKVNLLYLREVVSN